MEKKDKYITNSSFDKIYFSFDIDKIDRISEINQFGFRWFSVFEKKILMSLQIALDDPKQILIYRKNKPYDTLSYVYEYKNNNVPSYHKKQDCERMKSDFIDYTIPEEIRKQGIAKVLEFRNFFAMNFSKLKTEDFANEMKDKFGIEEMPQKIEIKNSGNRINFNYNLKDLKEVIDEKISEANIYYNSDPRIKAILNAFGFESSKMINVFNNHETNYCLIDLQCFVHDVTRIANHGDNSTLKITISADENHIIQSFIQSDLLEKVFCYTPEMVFNKSFNMTLMKTIKGETEYYCNKDKCIKKHNNTGYSILFIDMLKDDIAKNVQLNTILSAMGFKNKNKNMYNKIDISSHEIYNVIKHFHEMFKAPIMDLFIEYLKLKYNPELKFEGWLLDMLGFKPCSSCH